MQNASSLASMNSSFGPAGGPLPPGENDCEDFNDLMGIMSGAYDGTLDFIDRVIGDISSLLNSTGIAGLLSSIVSAISGAGGIVGDIITGIAGLITGFGNTILKTLGPLVGKVINAIADMTSVIGNEIFNIADMAAQLLRKALALVLGSAAIDPCKSKVLMNTGSDAMKDAVTRLNQPLGTSGPHSVGTTADDRAYAEEVKEAMKYSRDEALLEPGVPQSPYTEAAQSYTAYDNSLHDTVVSDYWTRKVLSAQYYAIGGPSVYADWMPKQLAYHRDAGDIISQMRKALSTTNFVTDAQKELKGRLKELIRLQNIQNRNIQYLRTNIKHEFTYTTRNPNWQDKIDDFHEREIAVAYQSRIKPSMTRIYNAAVTSLNNTKIAWDSIDSQLHT
jgi:hypothetical protein